MTDSTTTFDPADAPRPWYARPMVWGILALAFAAALMVGTCRRDGATRRRNLEGGVNESNATDLFANAVHQLHRLDRYESQSVMTQIVERFNQWLTVQKPDPDWKPDPLVAEMPPELVRGAGARTLDILRMAPTDADFLRDTAWLQDVANLARGEDADPLVRAERLLDWTVRNIQLDRGNPGAPPRTPGQVLLYGHGTEVERAWVFLLLCGQQQIDAALLTTGDPNDSVQQRPWLTAVLVSGELYLFDPILGLAVPGPGGVGIATLAQAAEDESVLRALDLPGRPYPFAAKDVERVLAWIAADPAALSQRMQRIEAATSGEARLTLSVNATALAERLRACPHVARVLLWLRPFEAVSFWLRMARQPDPAQLAAASLDSLPFDAQPVLMSARVMHFKGKFAADPDDQDNRSAVGYYQQARVPADDLRPLAMEMAARTLEQAKANQAQAAQLAPQPYERALAAITLARQSASYWLGLASYERGDYATAIDYLQHRVLEEDPDGPWSDGATYNLARCYEALGQFDKAIVYYEGDASAQRQGSLLRARRLRNEHPESAPAESTPAAPTDERPTAPTPPAEESPPAAEEPPAAQTSGDAAASDAPPAADDAGGSNDEPESDRGE